MFFLSILLGILSLIVGIALGVLPQIFFDFDIIGFSVFFVVPLGAFGIGYVTGWGYFKGMVLSHKQIKGIHLLISVIVMCIAFVSIRYTTYYLTCLNPETMEIYYAYDPVNHISNYEFDGYGQLTFIPFTKLLMDTATVSFSRRSRELGSVSNATMNYIFEVISLIGGMVGAFSAGLTYKSKPYCVNCQRYKKRKELFAMATASAEEFTLRLENALQTNAIDDVKAALAEYTMDKTGIDDHFALFVLIYCEKCQESVISIEIYKKNGKGRIEQDDNFEKYISIPHYYFEDYTTAA